MRRVHPALKVSFVLICLILVGVAPVVLTGYAELRQAESAKAAQDYTQAASRYERAAHLLPWRPELWEQAGLAMFHEDRAAAIQLFEIAGQHGALSAPGWEFYGTAYWAMSNDKKALEIWRAGLDQYPSYITFHYLIALAYGGLGDYPAERDALQKWLVAGEESALAAGAHYRLGQLLAASDSDRALQEFLLASQLDPEFDSVVQTLRTSLSLAALEPDESHRLLMIGRGLGLVEEWPLAYEAFQQAVSADGDNAEAWAWLGEAKQHLGRDERIDLDRALSLDNESVIVRGLRGLYWKRQGKYPQALAEYLLAAEFEPDNPAWRASIGESYTLLGDLASALVAYQRAIELAPGEAAYWRLLAVFCAENGIRVEDVGLPAAQKAVELAPEDTLALDALGWSYLSSGRLILAEQTLLEAIKRDPDYHPARLHLAMTYLSQGNSNAAYMELTHVRDTDPSGLSGQLAAQLLEQYFPLDK